MSLIVVGLSHKTAPIQLRERLAIPAHQLETSIDQLKNSGPLQEIVVLSTCNRTEVYARPQAEPSEAISFVSNFFTGLYGHADLDQALYRYDGIDAVHHLFRVASGLDSLVVGETEVLGQVKASYQAAHQLKVTGKITNVLFQRAIFVGKTVRNKTAISEGASSVGSIAVQLAERIFGSLNNHRILLLGAGKMAEITARHLLSQKASQLMILNRTKSKAEELAQLLNGQAGSLDELEKELLLADVVVCSTSSDKPLILKADIEKLMKNRRMKALYFIDIAVPRNVEAEVHELDNVYVYNIDDLQSLVRENLQNREREVGSAEELVKHMSQEFYEWTKAALSGQNKPLRHQV